MKKKGIGLLVEVYKPVVFFVVCLLLVLSVSRGLLVAQHWSRVDAVDGLLFVLLQGLRFDLIVAATLAVLPALLAPFIFHKPTCLKMVHAYLIAAFLLATFMEAATPTFIEEYDLRPNILFLEYLKYPQEVGLMLWGGYKLDLLGGLTIVCLLGLLFSRHLPSTYPGS